MNNIFLHCGVVAHLLEHYEVAMSSAAHMPQWWLATVVGEECKKDTGKRKKDRHWSRGHFFVVRTCGHIETWRPLYK